MDTPTQRQELRELVNRLYEECGIDVIPTQPKILIRVLPREQKIGRVWLADSKQNKPTWEGLVLKTFRPFMRRIFLEDVDWVADQPEPEARYTQLCKSDYEPGDHVLFPHIEFGILPMDVLDAGKGDYRLVPEHVIMAKLEYATEKKKEWLMQLLASRTEIPADGMVGKWLDIILENADVVRKDTGSMTTSGASTNYAPSVDYAAGA